MLKAILGKKIEQTQRFTQEGKRIPVTIIEAGPCPVVQVKTREKDGYLSIQLGFGEKKPKRTTKAIFGHIRGAKLKAAPRFLREIRIIDGEPGMADKLKAGDTVGVGDVFKAGDKIAVVGTSKGKGFAGVVKRWGFKGGPRTHGQSDRERAPGSIGSTTTPGRVYKGKKMAGRMGQDRVTVKGLRVVEVDPGKNLLVVSGVVPGNRDSFLIIQKQ
ncbi:MAG: 50S ribosomal protein L3 [bacterium]|nr:50S ribosomal protein L3 [bacterium]